MSFALERVQLGAAAGQQWLVGALQHPAAAANQPVPVAASQRRLPDEPAGGLPQLRGAASASGAAGATAQHDHGVEHELADDGQRQAAGRRRAAQSQQPLQSVHVLHRVLSLVCPVVCR